MYSIKLKFFKILNSLIYSLSTFVNLISLFICNCLGVNFAACKSSNPISTLKSSNNFSLEKKAPLNTLSFRYLTTNIRKKEISRIKAKRGLLKGFRRLKTGLYSKTLTAPIHYRKEKAQKKNVIIISLIRSSNNLACNITKSFNTFALQKNSIRRFKEE